jgi:hypothetical protein
MVASLGKAAQCDADQGLTTDQSIDGEVLGSIEQATWRSPLIHFPLPSRETRPTPALTPDCAVTDETNGDSQAYRSIGKDDPKWMDSV